MWPLSNSISYEPYIGPMWMLPQWLDLVLSVTVINAQAFLLNRLFKTLRVYPIRSFLFIFLLGFSHYVLGLASGNLLFLLWELTLVVMLWYILTSAEDSKSVILPYHLGLYMGLGLYFMPSSWVYFPSFVLMVLTISKLDLTRLFQWLLTTVVVILGIASVSYLVDGWVHRPPLFALPNKSNLVIQESSGVYTFLLLLTGTIAFFHQRFLAGSSTRYLKDLISVFTYLIIGTALHGLFYPRIMTTGFQLIIPAVFLLSLSLLSMQRKWVGSACVLVIIALGYTILTLNILVV